MDINGGTPVSLAIRTWRKLVRRIVRIFHRQGDTRAQVSKRIAVFLVGWGCFIGLLTWAGYKNGILHGVGDGIVSFCVLFVLALLTAPGYLVLGASEFAGCRHQTFHGCRYRGLTPHFRVSYSMKRVWTFALTLLLESL